MSEALQTRKRGVRLDGSALDRELAARGLRPDQLAHAAVVSEDVVSKARHDRPIDVSSLHKIVAALEKIPTRPLLAKLAARPESAPPPEAQT